MIIVIFFFVNVLKNQTTLFKTHPVFNKAELAKQALEILRLEKESSIKLSIGLFLFFWS